MTAADPTPTTFRGEIKVASTIIDYLSSGLYETPAACLKELVNNAYDADARQVKIFVKPDADSIVIQDDGTGMTAVEFRTHFERVSESHKRDLSDVTAMGRPIIGKIGIGFVAANEICEQLEVVSTKLGTPELLRVLIDFERMRSPATSRLRDGTDVAKADYEGSVEPTDPDAHYTWLFLSGIRGDSRRILASANRRDRASGMTSLYGRSPASVAEVLGDSGLADWGQLDAYSESFVHVGLNVPVRYLPGWMPDPWTSLVRPLERRVAKLAFEVEVDGAQLFKPTFFREPESSVCERFEFKGKHVSARGYFYAQRRGLKPRNLQGLLLRVRQTAVGEYDPGFWGFPSDEAPLFQSWASGEIWADDGLEDAVNIDRRTLRVVHPAYEELRDYIHEFLHDFFKRVRRELHADPAEARRQDSAVDEVRRVLELARQRESGVSPATRRLMQSVWRLPEGADDPQRVRRILRRFTVSELYEIALEVARETLSEEDADLFIRALTHRLGG